MTRVVGLCFCDVWTYGSWKSSLLGSIYCILGSCILQCWHALPQHVCRCPAEFVTACHKQGIETLPSQSWYSTSWFDHQQSLIIWSRKWFRNKILLKWFIKIKCHIQNSVVWMLSSYMHSKGIFRWMGALTKMTLISYVLEVMTLYMRE